MKNDSTPQAYAGAQSPGVGNIDLLDEILKPVPPRPLGIEELGRLGAVQTRASYIESRRRNILRDAEAGHPEHALEQLKSMIRDVAELRDDLTEWVKSRSSSNNKAVGDGAQPQRLV